MTFTGGDLVDDLGSLTHATHDTHFFKIQMMLGINIDYGYRHCSTTAQPHYRAPVAKFIQAGQ